MNPNNVISLEDRLPIRHFKLGDKIEYEMPSEIEYALNLISRLHSINYNPQRFFDISNQHLDYLQQKDQFDFIAAIDLAFANEWVCDDGTNDTKENILKIKLNNPELFNELYRHFDCDLDSQDLTDIIYSYFITSFFEGYNQDGHFEILIPFEDKKKLRKEAMKNSDTEAIDYLSQDTFYGVSPTRLIGDRKYWNL